MGLKAVIKSLEDVEEAVRGLYVKGQDGRFFLDVDAVEGFALENVDGLRNTVKATRDERDALAVKIKAFDDIARANDISPSIVANGISIALLTTLFGLIVAIIIQFFHNFFVSRIDKLIIDMEESSVELVDTLIEIDKAK